jgi:hypothetical protein
MDCPLLPKDWVMFLSEEINTRWMELLVGVIALVSFIIVLLSGMITLTLVIAATSINPARNILLILTILAFLCIMVGYCLMTSMLGRLKAIRDAVLTGKLEDSHEILECYLDAVGKSDEEKALEKNVKEQKEVMQSDINNTKESLREIKGVLEGSIFFSGWCTLGSLCVAIGFALMGLLFSLRYIDSSEFILAKSINLAVIFNFLLVLAGSLMICSAYRAGTDVNKYPNKSGIKTVKKLWGNNKLLFFGILFLFCDFLFVLIVL